MIIQVLGTRGNVRPSAAYHSRHSGVLIDQSLLLDCGEKSFLDYTPKYILITHLHPDHAFFIKKKEKSVEFSAPVYTPEPIDGLDVCILQRQIRLGAYTIIPIPTVHSQSVISQAYIIQKGKKRILYTGDLVSIDKKWFPYLSDLDLVITEASFMREGGLVRKYDSGETSGHTGIPNLIRLFENFSKQILFIHFGSWFYRDIPSAKRKLRNLGTEYGIKTIVGYDGLKLEV